MNVDTLLLPIAPDAPCGADLSFSLEFDAILEKRREDDPTLDQGAWVRALKVADWAGVAAQCERLLIERTKDLRVAGWLTDAWARVHGFGGLADGLETCERLCAIYWDGLHPQPDDGGMEQRAGSLGWLLGQVAGLVRLALAEAARSQAATPREFGITNPDEARRAVDALARLQQTVDPRIGVDGPGFGGARKALEDALVSVERSTRGAAGAAEAAAGPQDESAVGAGVGGGATPDAGAAGPLQSRAQALRQLRVVADFFRRTEPHSPVAYLADKAATWGEMPLHAWLKVVLKDPGALAHVEELLGVAPPPASS